MKATGIVRRVDELGRIVIPKEIRRTLHIREGDPLEIYTDPSDGCVCFKKYSPVAELSNFLRGYSDAVFRTLGIPVLISDRDCIIDVAGCSKRLVLDKPISAELEKLIERHENLITDRGEKIIPLTTDNSDKLLEYHAQVIFPIVADGEVMGTIILLPDGATKESQIKVAETMARMIGRQLEQ